MENLTMTFPNGTILVGDDVEKALVDFGHACIKRYIHDLTVGFGVGLLIGGVIIGGYMLTKHSIKRKKIKDKEDEA